MNDVICAYDTAAENPTQIWKLNAGFGYDINSAMLVEKNGVLFYGTKNGVLMAIDAKTGQLRWEHRLGVGIVNTVTPLNARQILASDFDGRVMLLEENP
jgi:outer membrane protein assembly factor BamB